MSRPRSRKSFWESDAPVTPVKDFYRYPATTVTALCAMAATGAWWAGAPVQFLEPRVQIQHGELWRLLSSCFLHIDLIHIAFNLYWLWYFGTFCERVFGTLRTAGLFVLLGVFASAVDFAVAVGGVGLSGIGYGLFTFCWFLSRVDPRFRGVMNSNIVFVFVFWFALCIYGTYAGFMHVANVAHGAGAVMGVVLGWMVSGFARTTSVRAVRIAAVLLLLGASLAYATVGRPWVNLSEEAQIDVAGAGYDALVADNDELAKRWLRAAVRMDSKDAASWFNLGLALSNLGDEPGALRAFEEAVTLNPGEKDFQDALRELRNSGSAEASTNPSDSTTLPSE